MLVNYCKEIDLPQPRVNYQNIKLNFNIEEPVKSKTIVKWFVVAEYDGVTLEVHYATRREAREILALDKACDIKSHIERREYTLTSTKKVS